MTDLIKRDDALLPCPFCRSPARTQEVIEDLWAVWCFECTALMENFATEAEAIAAWNTRALPAVDPAAIREAALLDAGYDTTLTDRIEELVQERDMLRDFDDHFRSMCGFKRDGRSSIECFDDFLAGINKQDIFLPFDHFLQVQKERDEALAKLAKAVEALQLISQMHGYTSRQLSDIARAVLAELEGKE